MATKSLASFLASLGPNYDADFVAEHLGSDDLNDIIQYTWSSTDLNSLVEQGMKPLLRNKLWVAICCQKVCQVSLDDASRDDQNYIKDLEDVTSHPTADESESV